jgi:ribose transport system permease protein
MYESFWRIPRPVWLLLVLLLGIGYLLRATRTGHYMFAVGSNRENSYLLGLPVDRIRVAAYVMSGVCSAIAGILLVGLIGTGAADAATPFQLNSIIATVVGGTSLFGGQGSVIGTVFGALILQCALKMLSYTNLLGSYILVVEGALVVLVVALASTAGHLRLRRRRSRA